MNKYENAIRCLLVMKGAECINMLGSEFSEHYGDENIKALELAIEALKRNTPMTPYMESDGYADGYPVWEYSCPECGCEFDEDRVCYCPDCGQKIVWADDVLEEE